MKSKKANKMKIKVPPDKEVDKMSLVNPEEAMTNVSTLVKAMSNFKDLETQYLKDTVCLFMEKLVCYNQQYVDILQSTYKDSDELSEKVSVIQSITKTRVALLSRVKKIIKGNRVLEDRWNEVIKKMDKLLKRAEEEVVRIQNDMAKIVGSGKVIDVKKKLWKMYEREVDVIIEKRKVTIQKLAYANEENLVIGTTDFEYEELDCKSTLDGVNWSKEIYNATAVIHSVHLQEANIWDLQTADVVVNYPAKLKMIDKEDVSEWKDLKAIDIPVNVKLINVEEKRHRKAIRKKMEMEKGNSPTWTLGLENIGVYESVRPPEENVILYLKISLIFMAIWVMLDYTKPRKPPEKGYDLHWKVLKQWNNPNLRDLIHCMILIGQLL